MIGDQQRSCLVSLQKLYIGLIFIIFLISSFCPKSFHFFFYDYKMGIFNKKKNTSLNMSTHSLQETLKQVFKQ